MFARAESGAIAVLGTAIYVFILDGTLLLFVVAILLPDIAMAGYLWDERIGALFYNSMHVYVVPAALIGYGLFTGTVLIQQVAALWGVHIAADRALGFGLKEETGFHDTHLGRIPS